MKKIYASLVSFLQYPGVQTELVLMFVIIFVQAFWFAYVHQTTGHVPVVSAAWHLPSYRYVLPFPVSRLWDLLIGPAYLFLHWMVLKQPFFLEDDDYTGRLMDGVANGLGTLVMIMLFVTWIGGVLAGAAYVLPVFIWVFVVCLSSMTVRSLIRARKFSRS